MSEAMSHPVPTMDYNDQQEVLQEMRRERELYEALDEAWNSGISEKAMRVLVRETGASWTTPQGDA